MSRIVCYTSKDGQIATCIRSEVACHLCDVRIPDDARSSIRDGGDNLPSDCDNCTYKRFAANMRNAEARDNQMRDEGAKRVLGELRYWLDYDEFRNKRLLFSESDTKQLRKKIDDVCNGVKK